MKFRSEKERHIVWDAENNKPLAVFQDHNFQTTDERVIQKLEAAGFTGITGPEDEKEELKPLEKQSAAQLKAFAKEQNIDLGEATKKEDILPIIQAELAKREGGGNQGGGAGGDQQDGNPNADQA